MSASIGRRAPGVTLTELMVAVAIMSIGVLGLVGTFVYIQEGIQLGKNKTLASNLAQEKMQIIEQQSYFRVLPTVSPSFLSDGTPYDASNFPPESILEGGVTFERYTYVQVISENNGAIVVDDPTTPDTGMRQITVTVTWNEGSTSRKLQITSVMSNPNTVEANSVLTGTVKNASTGSPITGATVNVAENIGWRDSTDGAGTYTIHLSPGTFNLVASCKGYFTQYDFLAVDADQTVTQNFSLVPMASGTVTGAAWLEPGPLISQIVVSSVQAGGFDAEYLELYNPTTSSYLLNGEASFSYYSGNNNIACTNVPLVYVNSTLPAGGYFLISNTGTITLNGTSVAADAYYNDTANLSCSPLISGWSPPSSKPLMQRSHSGTWVFTWNGTKEDAVGWTNGGSTHNPSYCNGTCIPLVSGALAAGNQIFRNTAPGTYTSGEGPAYNSGGNSVDFQYPASISGIVVTPHNSLSAVPILASGVPAVGAIVSASDGLSSPVTASSSGSPPSATFSLPGVATGTWTVLITSGSYALENDTVTIASQGSTYVFASTSTLLTGAATNGFIAGYVTDGFGNAISAPSAITVSGGGQSTTANTSTGRYFLPVSVGYVDTTANSGFANPNYVAVTSAAVSVSLGEITDGVNFVLTQGGRLKGWVSRDGINGLPNVTVTATDSNGNVQDQELSNSSGYWTTVNISTGAYTINIPLDTTEVSSPTFLSATAVVGTTVFAGSMTIVGALGTISGSVTQGGSPVSTGALIIASTGTFSSPPTISSASLTSGAYYITSSLENGTYSLSVRSSTYTLTAYYTTISNSGGVAISSQSIANVAVVSGGSVSGKNFSFP